MVPTVAPGLVRCNGPGESCVAPNGFHRQLRTRQLGEAEIENFHLSALSNKYVRRFDVAMDNSFGVRGLERV